MGKSICRRHSSPYPWFTVLLQCGAKKLSHYSDSLRAERFGVRIPVGTRFSATVQAGSGAHPAFCIMGTGSLPGVKRTVRGVGHPPPWSVEVKERVQQYPYFPSGPVWPVIGRTGPLPLPGIETGPTDLPTCIWFTAICLSTSLQMLKFN